ncbi:DNA/RNA non-specific endonuclease [Capnocytophaga gingivalis]|jgi:hypothetical protein|uniref:DNA/RNA non-specific endonuclease n=1 Tax=Capnocytophaga gingivalis TaxID=1017 RepID=UPI0028F0B115|nr:DNA/RNA non-specific endonuclease [Capnocytophaga gingivalis]
MNPLLISEIKSALSPLAELSKGKELLSDKELNKSLGKDLAEDIYKIREKESILHKDKIEDLSKTKERVIDASERVEGKRNVDINRAVLEPNVLYKVEEKHFYGTDALGRVDRVIAKLHLDSNNSRDTNIQIRSVYEKDGNRLRNDIEGKDLPKDDGGHLIARQFGGASEMINLVPMNSRINRGAFKRIEGKCKTALITNKDVWFDIKIDYKDDIFRPNRFIIDYTIDGEVQKRILGNGRSTITESSNNFFTDREQLLKKFTSPNP